MKLAPARALAEKVREALAPACMKIEIGGSIRRGQAEVGDIDLVALPHPGKDAELARLFRACAAMGGLILDGAIAKRCRLRKSEVQCDLWIAKHAVQDLIAPIPCNWGGMLLTYTGSIQHNIKLVERAKTMGKTFRPGWGVIEPCGQVHATTEAEIFDALELPYLEPGDRK